MVCFLSILAASQGVLNDFLLEAQKVYLEAQRNLIKIHTPSRYGGSWRLFASRPKRPMSSIILDPGVKNVLVEDMKDFLSSKGWYAARGIPFRRGYLLVIDFLTLMKIDLPCTII